MKAQNRNQGCQQQITLRARQGECHAPVRMRHIKQESLYASSCSAQSIQGS
jgi:hypothetical protein